MHLLSTACTAERREKSHRYDACGRQEKTVNKGGVSRPFMIPNRYPNCKRLWASQESGLLRIPNMAPWTHSTVILVSCFCCWAFSHKTEKNAGPCAIKTTSEEQTELQHLSGVQPFPLLHLKSSHAGLSFCSAVSDSCYSVLDASDLIELSAAAAAHLLLWFDIKTEGYANGGIRQPRWRQKSRQNKENAEKAQLLVVIDVCRCRE